MSDAKKAGEPAMHPNPWTYFFPAYTATRPAPAATFADLERLSQREPVVRSFLDAWRAGEFASLEQCLAAMVVHLAQANRRLLDAESHRAMLTPVLPDPDSHSAAVGQQLMLGRVRKVIRDMMHPQPVKPFSAEGKSVELPDDFVPPVERGEAEG